MAVLPRQSIGSNNNICYDSFGNQYYCRSSWNSWGRWVALAVIIVVFLLFFFLCSCFTARRRRRAGRQPFYGTGWAGGHGRPTYNPNATSQQPNYNVNAPPAYGANQGGYYGENQGYFGGQQTETEMQPPQNVYRGDGNGYAAPDGPPPKKGDGIVR